MRIVVQFVLLVTLVLDLAGCYRVVKMPDIATASVYGPHVSGGPLSPQKVAQLSGWINAHDAGWRGLMETPTAPITMAIVMRDPGGRQTSLDLFESRGGTAMAYLYAPSPALPLERYLPEADVTALKAAVGN
jgi:hypothetical protein